MRKFMRSLAIAAFVATAKGQSAEDDLVASLPGSEGMGFTNQYAGYLDLPGTEKHVSALSHTL